MKVSEFDYTLPEELIASHPVPCRSDSRMLVLDRDTGSPEISAFPTLCDRLRPGDVLVLNDTKVLASRLSSRKAGTGAAISITLIHGSPGSSSQWQALLKPGKRARVGTVLEIGEETATVLEKTEDGFFTLQFSTYDVPALLVACGAPPLPPYMRRTAEQDDHDRYQTVYATQPGAVAAPTAGLHFTNEILTSIREKGVDIVPLTLHVGYGTFKPVAAEDTDDHPMHAESFELSADSAARINRAKASGGRVVAVGTTSVRVLETLASDSGIKPGAGETNIFLVPPYTPKVVDCLLTNFHLPRSTLLMLVSCFATRERILDAYQAAIAAQMRFYSYGDCMFLTQNTRP
ncbi:MAG TPA: tRNA preQ1(34) S-adenosylmethionine ribosyltransferase-isomerase QueA [Lentisphaeria bacterium]|nr:tRNA preQ1(34) S-adenosylmethionine ribosyltransferase-isomerase QueA [Lentisphaeria bacterium]